jgi:hypothetical protein
MFHARFGKWFLIAAAVALVAVAYVTLSPSRTTARSENSIAGAHEHQPATPTPRASAANGVATSPAPSSDHQTKPTPATPLLAAPKIQQDSHALAGLKALRANQSVADAIARIQSDATLTTGQKAVAKAQALLACAYIARAPITIAPGELQRPRPNAEIRRTAWESSQRSVLPDRCKDLKRTDYSAEAINREWSIAAQEGDARGIAAMLDLRLRDPSRAISTMTVGELEVKNWQGPSAEDVKVLLKGLESKDPAFIQMYGPIFTESFADVDFVMGTGGEKLSMEGMFRFWNLVSCYFGADCSANHSGVASTCAEEGNCYSSYEEFFRETSSPEGWAQIERLLPQVVNAIISGNWDGVITRKSPPSGLDPMFNNQNKDHIRLRPPPG